MIAALDLRTFDLSATASPILRIEPAGKDGDIFDLSSLDGSNGFMIVPKDGQSLGLESTRAAGDVNGDGYGDLILGTPWNDSRGSGTGSSFILYGSAAGFDASVVPVPDGVHASEIVAARSGERIGLAVGSAGDINGDGIGDLVLGSPYTNGKVAEAVGGAFVVFGQQGGLGDKFSLLDLDGTNGFQLVGVDHDDQAGIAVSAAGDVNGDGYGDLLIGAPGGGPQDAGAGYVVFGKASGFDARINLSSLHGADGFRIDGVSYQDAAGWALSGAGDVNGDGFDDIIIGASQVGTYSSGAAYVVFGKAAGFGASFALSSLDGANGFAIEGSGYTGWAVCGAGDVNGDGFADVLASSPRAIAHGQAQAGIAHVIFGSSFAFDASIDPRDLDGSNGFNILGDADHQLVGWRASTAGDFNGDGFGDLVLTSEGDDAVAYVVFGSDDSSQATIDLGKLDAAHGLGLGGLGFGDPVDIGAVGDLNGDGLADLSVTGGGEGYIVYGQAPTTAVHRTGTDASQSLVGGELKDSLSGLGGDDALWGHGGKDKLTGGNGDDTLVGGTGKDALIGQAGADVFQYRDLADSTLKSHDTIKALGVTDVIDLHLLDADAGTDGDQAFHIVSAFSGQAGELVLGFDGKQTLVQGDVDGDGAADLVIAITGDHHDFTNFVL